MKRFTLFVLAALSFFSVVEATPTTFDISTFAPYQNQDETYQGTWNSSTNKFTVSNDWGGGQKWMGDTDWSSYGALVVEVTSAAAPFQINLYSHVSTEENAALTTVTQNVPTSNSLQRFILHLDENKARACKFEIKLNSSLSDAGGAESYDIVINSAYLVTNSEEISTTLWSDATGTSLSNWGGLDNADIKAGSKKALIGDKFRVTIKDATIHSGNSNVSLMIANAVGWAEIYSKTPTAQNNEQTIDFEIDNASNLEIIQQNGIVVKGCDLTVTKVELITFASSYDAVPLTIGEDGVVSFGSSKNLDFSGVSDVTPYYVKALGTNCVYLKSVSTTRAWAGYIVQGTAGTYNIPVANSQPDWIDAFHYLHYSGDYNGNWVYRSAYSDYSDGNDTNNEDTTTDEYKIKNYFRYIFAKDNEGNIGFYRLAPTYSREINVDATTNTVYYHILNAHKAYLETPSDITTDITTNSETGAPMIHLVFDEENNTTNVEDIRADEEVYKFFQNGHLLITRGGIMYDAMGRIINKH